MCSLGRHQSLFLRDPAAAAAEDRKTSGNKEEEKLFSPFRDSSFLSVLAPVCLVVASVGLFGPPTTAAVSSASNVLIL